MDRAGEMYSASLSKSTAWAVKKSCIKKRRSPRPGCTEQGLPGSPGGGYGRADGDAGRRLPTPSCPPLNQVADETALWLKTHPGAPEEDAVLSLYFDVLRYLKVAELYDGHYRTLLTFAKGTSRPGSSASRPVGAPVRMPFKGRSAVFFRPR